MYEQTSQHWLVWLYLKHLVMSERPVGHHHAVVELVQRSPSLRRLVVVAQFDQCAALLVEEQRVVGGHPPRHNPLSNPSVPGGSVNISTFSTTASSSSTSCRPCAAVTADSTSSSAAAPPVISGRRVRSCISSPATATAAAASSSSSPTSAILPSALILRAIKRNYCVVEHIKELVLCENWGERKMSILVTVHDVHQLIWGGLSHLCLARGCWGTCLVCYDCS